MRDSPLGTVVQQTPPAGGGGGGGGAWARIWTLAVPRELEEQKEEMGEQKEKEEEKEEEEEVVYGIRTENLFGQRRMSLAP